MFGAFQEGMHEVERTDPSQPLTHRACRLFEVNSLFLTVK